MSNRENIELEVERESRGWHDIGNKTENVEQELEWRKHPSKESRGWQQTYICIWDFIHLSLNAIKHVWQYVTSCASS